MRFDTKGLALVNAQALAAAIDSEFTSATYDRPGNPATGSTDGGLLIARGGAIKAGPIDAQGFAAVLLQNNKSYASVSGGGDPSGQVVLAGRGGLDYEAASGNATVDAGGGDNTIVFGSGDDVFYSTDGNNTVTALGGSDTIYAGIGANTFNLFSGSAYIGSTGDDTIYLGSGTASVTVSGAGSDSIVGAVSVSGSGYSLTFLGGELASTIDGGAGSYSIQGGVGGGNFTGGSAGDNYINGGSGSATITGGGNGDTLIGGSGTNDYILAGGGNETLYGGSGSTEFAFDGGFSGGAGTTAVITDFTSEDYLHMYGSFTNAYALDNATVSDGSTFISLEDGTKVELLGFTGLNANNFK